jgi:hypothetical protein
MEIGYERLDPPASPDLRLVETTVELESAAVVAEVEPALACLRLALAFLLRRSAYSCSNPAIE